jgi:hypothetical protein
MQSSPFRDSGVASDVVPIHPAALAAQPVALEPLTDANHVSLRDVQALYADALEVFDGPECPQSTRDVIEWYASSLSVLFANAAHGTHVIPPAAVAEGLERDSNSLEQAA